MSKLGAVTVSIIQAHRRLKEVAEEFKASLSYMSPRKENGDGRKQRETNGSVGNICHAGPLET